MVQLTASEAARRFSAVLDGAEEGETYVITRGGRQVAMIVPAPRANGGAVVDLLRHWEGRVALDDEFAHTVATADEALAGLDADPWRA